LSSDGSIWDWVFNSYGELGLGTTAGEYRTPQHLLPPAGYAFISIATNAEGDGAVATVAAVSVPEPALLGLLPIAAAALLGRCRRNI